MTSKKESLWCYLYEYIICNNIKAVDFSAVSTTDGFHSGLKHLMSKLVCDSYKCIKIQNDDIYFRIMRNYTFYYSIITYHLLIILFFMIKVGLLAHLRALFVYKS